MKAVVLARGLGTRMQSTDPAAVLTPEQRRAADAGLKPLMPIGGRPFLDYLLSALADAGLDEIGLVVAPAHGPLADYVRASPPSRLRISFIVQPEALGTANAVICAQRWIDGEPFLAMNADNLYPVPALTAMVALGEPGLPAFEAGDLVRTSNIPEERINAFAILDIDADGYLTGIVEKPAQVTRAAHGRRYVSMNLWRFDSRIFAACRDVPPSTRGEVELPGAVELALRRGLRFRAVPARGPVLDLSRRADAIDVERRLAGVVPRP